MILFTLKFLVFKEILLAAPVLVLFECVQLMNMYSAEGILGFISVWFYRMMWVLIFRVAFEPTVFNTQKIFIMIRNYLVKKAKFDDKYEKYLSWVPATER